MRKSDVLLSLALLGSATVSCWLWAELRAERSRSAELAARLEAPTPVLSTPAVPLAKTQDEASAVMTSIAPASVLAEPPASPALVAEEDPAATERRLMRDPRYREAWRDGERTQMAQRRENLIRLVGLTPQQADAVVDISIDRHLKWIDRESPDPMTPEDLNQQDDWDAANERADQAKLRVLLGEEKRAQLQTYMESRGARIEIDRLRAQLPAADALRDDQAESLITALHVEQAQMRQQMDEYSKTLDWERDADKLSQEYAVRQNKLMKEAHERVHATAAPILSRNQLELLDALLLRNRQRLESEQRLSGLQRKLEPQARAAANN